MELIMLKDKMNQLLEQEMDRKDFLKNVGIAIVGLVGISSVLSAFGQFGQKQSTDKQSRGYGNTAYGR